MDNNLIQVVKVMPADVGTLRQIGWQTYYETFESTNTPENLDMYLKAAFDEQKLTEELNNPESQFYFLLVNSQPAGYLKVNFNGAQTDLHDDKSLEVERIYVLSKFHGKKLGQILLDKALQIGREHNLVYIWLGVWENNGRALRFYEKNGFTPIGTHVFTVGDDPQTDIIMKLAI